VLCFCNHDVHFVSATQTMTCKQATTGAAAVISLMLGKMQAGTADHLSNVAIAAPTACQEFETCNSLHKQRPTVVFCGCSNGVQTYDSWVVPCRGGPLKMVEQLSRFGLPDNADAAAALAEMGILTWRR
jgi:hypothetical protein